jgi:hypothetical protein
VEPSELVSAFTADRLRVLAEILVDVRRQAIGGHEPSKGDTNWGLGCRVYERTCYAIEQAVKKHDWLAILDLPLHFVFLVDGVPLRFGSGDPDDPSTRLLRRRQSEEDAQQLAFELADDPAFFEWRWRLIVETEDDTLEAARVVLVQASSEGDVANQWEIDWGDARGSTQRRQPKTPFDPKPPAIRPKSPPGAQTAG